MAKNKLRKIEKITLCPHDIGSSAIDYFLMDKINELVEQVNLVIEDILGSRKDKKV
jgi:hypothetical protein